MYIRYKFPAIFPAESAPPFSDEESRREKESVTVLLSITV